MIDDCLEKIIRNRTLYDNIINCSVSKNFYILTCIVIEDQIKQFFYFKKLKRISKKFKKIKTYYFLKNKCINN